MIKDKTENVFPLVPQCLCDKAFRLPDKAGLGKELLMVNKRSEIEGRGRFSRREFLWLSSMSTAGFLAGCAANPVTGKSQLMLMSESQEISLDKQHSPHQFSTDYGAIQDKALNEYINRSGKNMGTRTHRPHMPYSFRVVNATYVNAYAFPGGSIAVTRGILLKLHDEAELAALLGHELGHVNARHAAEQSSKGMLTQLAVAGLAVAVGASTDNSSLSELAANLGMLGAGALLASYSRDNEREADALGMEYMVRSRYSPRGMIGLMDVLKSLHKDKPNAARLLFSTHPMSDERYNTAVRSANTRDPSTKDLPLHRERFMDHTAALRAHKDAIEEMQKGESEMAKKRYSQAETHFKTALKRMPDDYAGLLMMSKCLLAQDNSNKAVKYAEKAKKVYPSEAQAHHVSGFTKIKEKRFDEAFEDFKNYDRLLPGNPNTNFFKGLSLEGMKRIDPAANQYISYLKKVNQGSNAKHAYTRLVQWGYIKPQQRR